MNDGPPKKKVHHQVSYVWPACRTPKHPVFNIKMATIDEKCQNARKCQNQATLPPLLKVKVPSPICFRITIVPLVNT